MAADSTEKTVDVVSNVSTDSATLEPENAIKVKSDDAANIEHLDQLRQQYGVRILLISKIPAY
jgi:hypothetical protein